MTSVSPQSESATPLPPRRIHFAVLALFFAAIAIYGSWVPFETISLSVSDAWEMVWSRPLISFGRIDRSDWATNALVMVPISFCLLGACAVDRPRAALLWISIPCILAGCLALSIVVEFGQLWLPKRFFSGNDILAQTVGAVGGIILWLIAGQRITAWLRSYSGQSSTRRQICWLLQAYLVGLLLYALLPLDLTIHPEEVYEKMVSHRLVLIPFSETVWNWATLGELLTDAIVFIPVGALAAIGWLPPGKSLRPLPESIFVGGAIVLAVEICQFPVMSRFTDATDVVTGTVGVAIGAAVMHVVIPHDDTATTSYTGLQTWHWLLLTGVYSLIVVAYFWLPFDLIQDRPMVRDRFHQMLRVPGASLLAVSQFRALTEILQKGLLFLPLGALSARSVDRPGAARAMRYALWAASLLYVAALAMLVEVGQVLNRYHTPDIFDVVLCMLGASVGMLVTIRLLKYRHRAA